MAAPGYAIAVEHIDPTAALWASVAANIIFLLAQPVWGMLSDRWGRRPVATIFAIGSLVLVYPLNQLIKDSAWQLFTPQDRTLLPGRGGVVLGNDPQVVLRGKRPPLRLRRRIDAGGGYRGGAGHAEGISCLAHPD
ncbi:MFS transporter [Streptomyces sp. NPDC059802]|uniref:MFS transporter n=1 Tax=Streptomyces sp. NPDC059802 TaxID=3346952 RepID=UPI00364686BC